MFQIHIKAGMITRTQGQAQFSWSSHFCFICHRHKVIRFPNGQLHYAAEWAGATGKASNRWRVTSSKSFSSSFIWQPKIWAVLVLNGLAMLWSQGPEPDWFFGQPWALAPHWFPRDKAHYCYLSSGLSLASFKPRDCLKQQRGDEKCQFISSFRHDRHVRSRVCIKFKQIGRFFIKRQEAKFVRSKT